MQYYKSKSLSSSSYPIAISGVAYISKRMTMKMTPSSSCLFSMRKSNENNNDAAYLIIITYTLHNYDSLCEWYRLLRTTLFAETSSISFIVFRT